MNNDKFNINRGAVVDELYPLPGSRSEVDSIASTFSHANKPVKVYKDKNATELSVKSLPSGKYTILHIATHGYYLSSSESGGSLLSILNKLGNSYNLEDATLTRSGLFLAGANTTLDGGSNCNSDNDGILTAKEIANIDLNSFDMVSLSACQTGLGDISSDGVYGVQRGFKKSGVKSILMSLWNVDDKATSALMTEFYNQWISGLSKYEALEAAKSTIKKTQGWEEPKYWAPFILLDGIN